MEIPSVSCVCFSPTGTTKTIVYGIAQGIEAPHIEMIDCTNRALRQANSSIFDNELVILAAPVYYGRLPVEITPFFKTLKGNNTPVILAVVYGNREYEDALLELHDIAVAQGFIPIAAGAFIGEHSYSNSVRPIAHERPDIDDIDKTKLFGLKIKTKIENAGSFNDMERITVPGDKPYIEPKNLEMLKEVRKTLAFTPDTDLIKCTQCDLCAELCPTMAIDTDDTAKIDRWQCILCFACIKNCPAQAKEMTDANFNNAIQQLQMACQKRKEPEMYL